MRTIKPITDREIDLLRLEPQSIVQLMPRLTLSTRIVARLVVDEVTGCWRISGWNSGNGFAKMRVGNRCRQVHRIIYTLLEGPIPDGAVLDHKKSCGCIWRDCGYPGHLEPVTVQVNTARGDAVLFSKGESYAS